MTKGFDAVGAIVGALMGILALLIGREGLIALYSADPVSMVGYTVMMVSVGYLLCLAVHHVDIASSESIRLAESAARTERENREHAERMRREQEEREAEKRAEEERINHKRQLETAAVEFKTYEVDVKAMACVAYDEGEVIASCRLEEELGIPFRQATRLMECETLPRGQYRYTLKPRVQEMLDAYPELLADIRPYVEQRRSEKLE